MSAFEMACAAQVGYSLRGIRGFGSGLVAVPLLALVFPLSLVVPFILLLDFSASLVLGGVDFRQVRWDEVKPLVPLGVVGVTLGTTLLVSLPKEPLLIGPHLCRAQPAQFAWRKTGIALVGAACQPHRRHGGWHVRHRRAALCDLSRPSPR